jgi:hypothetical protein
MIIRHRCIVYLHQNQPVVCYDRLRLSMSDRNEIHVTPSCPMLDQAGKMQRLTRTDEACIHLQRCPWFG